MLDVASDEAVEAVEAQNLVELVEGDEDATTGALKGFPGRARRRRRWGRGRAVAAVTLQVTSIVQAVESRARSTVGRSSAPAARELERFEVGEVLWSAGGALHRDHVLDGGDGHREAVEVHAVRPASQCGIAR